MKNAWKIHLVTVVFAFAVACAHGAGFPSWQKQMEIVFNGYPGASDPLTNFPALVVLQDGSNGVDFADFEPNGVDLRFTAADATTELNFEIEKWDAVNGVAHVWVQVPELTNSTKVLAYWEKSGALLPAYATDGSTWSEAYAGVWHLAETNGTHADATTINPAGTAQSGIDQDAAGIVDGADAFPGASHATDFVTTPETGIPSGATGEDITVAFWINPDTLVGNQCIVGLDSEWMINMESSGKIYVRIFGGNNSGTLNAVSAGAWHHVVARWDAGVGYDVMVNGVFWASVSATSADISTDSGNPLLFGKVTNGGAQYNDPYNGLLDEVRVSTVLRSDDWNWASWMTVASNTVLINYGTAEAAGLYAAADTLAPTNVTSTGASLNGSLTSTGATETTTFVFWGETDGGTSAWDQTNDFGVAAALGPLTANVTLEAGKEYFYRFAASNALGLRWAATTEYLVTTNVTVGVVPGTVGESAETAIFSFARPLGVTSGALRVTYTVGGTAEASVDYAVAPGSEVTIPAGQTNATFVVTTIPDAWVEGSETVTAALEPGAYAPGAFSSTALTIANTAAAAVNSTTSAGEWQDAGVWSEGYVPLPGQHAWVQHALLLDGDTAELSGATVTNATLMFTNWTTRLRAVGDVAIARDGWLTTPLVAALGTDLHRVHVLCSNFTIQAGSGINVDAKGYGGGWDTAGKGPGAGSGNGGGAGHGGRGGDRLDSATAYKGASPYGGPEAPEGPGSGGGSTDARAGHKAGNGGGAVRIEASGRVAVDGTITADASAGGGYSGGGSGGAIWISCATFAANGGQIGANGNNGAQGGGGGGRVAITVDSSAQTVLPAPDVVLSTKGGLTTVGSVRSDADIGTVYFTDPGLLAPVVQHSGQLHFATNASDLAFDSLTVSNGWLRFADSTSTITITNDLVVTGSSARLDCGGNSYYTATGLWRIQNTTAHALLVSVGGDLTLSGGGDLVIVAPATNEVVGALSVEGDISIGSGSWMTPYSHLTLGGSPEITCRNLDIDSGGGIDADSGGFDGGRNTSGKGPGTARYGGAGYGGRGGAYSATRAGGPTYGSTNAPVQCGSGGGANDNGARIQFSAGRGGGLVRIDVGNRIAVGGTISANGGAAGAAYSSGGSGGGIYLTCRRFEGTGGTVRANGGSGVNYGGGGGGRVAVWHGGLATEDTHPSDLLITNAPPDTFTGGTVTATGGSGVYEAGFDGTIVFIENLSRPGTIVILR